MLPAEAYDYQWIRSNHSSAGAPAAPSSPEARMYIAGAKDWYNQ